MRKQKNSFGTSRNDEWYDLIDDYDLIESSFAEQYGIRLRRESDMSWGEFATLLAGLNEKTALGKIVSIRSEKDPKIIKNFTKEQKMIRSAWQKRQVKTVNVEDYNKAMKKFEDMFMAMAK